MTRYRVDTEASRLVVQARSSVHDTYTTWSEITGDIDADVASLEGASAGFAVDMTAFDAGDWLKNRKLKKDLDVAGHPRATLELTGVRDVVRKDGDRFEAVATGVLRWRGRELELAISGEGAMDADHIEATGTFDLDVRDLGVKPPRFLMLKVEDVVTVTVTLRARAVQGD